MAKTARNRFLSAVKDHTYPDRVARVHPPLRMKFLKTPGIMARAPAAGTDAFRNAGFSTDLVPALFGRGLSGRTRASGPVPAFASACSTRSKANAGLFEFDI